MSKLFNKIIEKNERFNPAIVNGVAKILIKNAAAEIDAIIRSGLNTLDPEIPLSYNGYRYMDPKELFLYLTKGNASKEIDISKSTLYGVVYEFEFNGVKVDRVLLLPYVENGAKLYLSNTPYNVSPVLSEYVISSVNNIVFVRLMKDKLNFRKQEKNIIIDGEKMPVSIVVSKLYKFNKSAKVNDKIPVAILLFVKYGLKGVMEDLLGLKDYKVVKESDITNEDRERYRIYMSTGTKPRSINEANYRPHEIAVLVNKDEANHLVDTIVGSLIVCLDLSPKLGSTLVDIEKMSEIHKKNFWLTLLGRIVYKNKYTIGKIIEDMSKYISLVNEYIEPSIKKKLIENNILVNDFYELIFYIIKNFNYLALHGENRSANIENRYIDIMYYILYDIMSGFNKAFYSIDKEFVERNKSITVKDIIKKFDKNVRPKMIYGLTSRGLNIALAPIDYSGDNYFTKITAILEDQNRGEGVKASKNNTFPPSIKTLHAADLVIGNLLYLPKKSPSPRVRINPYLEINYETGRVLMDDKLKKTVSKLEKLLEGKFENDEIIEKETLDTDIYG